MHLTRTRTLWLCAALCAAALGSVARAQVAPATQPDPGAATTGPVATTQPEATTQPVAATQPALATAPARISPGPISLKFTDAPIETVLDYLSQAAGFIIVRDNNVKLEGRVTVDSQRPIGPDEAVTLLNTLLQNSGATAIRMEGRVLKIMSIDDAKKGLIPVHFGSDPSAIAKTDELITQVIPVTSVDAVKLRADLTPLLSPTADVIANAGSNSIVVTDTSAHIHRLAEIIKSLDQQRTTVSDVRVFQLKFASASAAAKLINDVFKPSNSGTAGPQGPPFMRFFGRGRGGPGGPGGAAGTENSNDGSTIGGQVVASSDDRTNTVVVSGPTGTLAVVERVIKELDANPAQGQVFFTVHLRNADSMNLQSVLNSFFGAGGGGSSSNSRALGGASSTPFGSTGFASSGGGGSSRGGMSGGSFGSTSSSSANRTTGGAAGQMPQALLTNSDLIGHVFVVAEPDTNSLLVTTTQTYADRVRAMIADLDRAVPQVLIKVLIAEVQHNNTNDIGIEGSILNQQNKLGTNFGVGNAITTLMASGSPVGAIYTLSADNFSVALRALAETTKMDVLSRPYILASDNQLASVMSGQVVPYISSANVTDTGLISNSVSYQQVGVILNVTPHINPEGLVILDVNPQVSSLSTSTIQIQPGVNAPIFNLLQAQSRVAVQSGQTIIIGGLMQDTENETVDKVPILGDIPYLGLLFQHKVVTKGKNELLIFLTPHVAQDPDVLQGMTKQEESSSKLVQHAVGPGVYQQQMKAMDTGATTLPAGAPPISNLLPATQPQDLPAHGTPQN